MRKEKRKGRQKRGRGEVEANCIGRAKLGIDLLAIHPSSKGQSGDVSHANLEPDHFPVVAAIRIQLKR